MRSLRTTLAAVVTAALLAGLAGGFALAPSNPAQAATCGGLLQPPCPAPTPTPTPTPAPPPPYPTPSTGSCHALTAAELGLRSDSDRPVPCGSRHQSLTVRVLPLRQGTHRSDWADILHQTLRSCWRATAGRVGGWPALVGSWYGNVEFLPTKHQWSRGARWVRCDLILTGGRRTLQALPSNRNLSLPMSERELWCRQGKSNDYRSVPCSRRHQFHVGYRVYLNRWTSKDAVARYVRRKCLERYVSDDVSFFSDYPSTRRWFRWGDTWGVCLPQTTGTGDDLRPLHASRPMPPLGARR